MATVKLGKPFKVGEAEVTELVLNLETMSGEDAMKCAALAARARGNPYCLEERLDDHYLIEVAAHASGIDAALLRKLPIGDFHNVKAAVRDFFDAWG